MEEILASIRRIIADDQEVLRSASRDRGTPSSLTNVLDLTERQTAQMVGSSSHEAEDREPETERRSERAYHEVDHAENDLQLVSYHDEPEDAPEDFTQLSEGIVDSRGTDTLLSSAADASVSDAFTRLGSTLMPTKPQTLDDLMKDMLRPMLKAWLEANLPTLVERLVQAEIDRIARRQ